MRASIERRQPDIKAGAPATGRHGWVDIGRRLTAGLCCIGPMILASSAVHAAPRWSATISYYAHDITAKHCAIALSDNRAVLDAGMRIETKVLAKTDTSPSSSGYLNPDAPHLDIHVEAKTSGGHIIGAPLAFRDPQHLIAYLQSNAFREMRSYDQSYGPIAVAYGGYSQLFSKNAAVTEARHLKDRAIGGARAGFWLYVNLGANAPYNPSLGKDDTIAEAAEKMGNDYRPSSSFDRQFRIGVVDLVDAPIIGAFENGLDRHARYLNLISTAVQPVYIGQISSISEAAPELWKPAARWMESSAMICSAANFKLEQDTLARLKSAGLQVVPFNRSALIETGWKGSLLTSRSWTTKDLDRLVAAGTGVPSRRPSDIVSQFSAEDRRKYRSEEKDAADRRSDTPALTE